MCPRRFSAVRPDRSARRRPRWDGAHRSRIVKIEETDRLSRLWAGVDGSLSARCVSRRNVMGVVIEKRAAALPRSAHVDPAMSGCRIAPCASWGRRVLIVDDHELLAQLLVRALREEGLDATRAESTQEGDVV